MSERVKVGRRKKYETAEKLSRAVSRYFNSIMYDKPMLDENGEQIKALSGEPIVIKAYAEPPSIQNLCVFLGIDTSTWDNYREDERLKWVCNDTKLRIEAYLVGEVNKRDRPQGVIFNLENNFGWKKKKEVELGDKTAHALSAASLPMEEKEKILREIAQGLVFDDENCDDSDE